jgi:adenine phosphoribosyltransferase
MDLEEGAAALKALIRDVPDFPKKGIIFKDITTLLKDPQAFQHTMDLFEDLCSGRPVEGVVGIESRGFILGAILADRLGVGFVPIRKPGKLPAPAKRATYELEYGTDALEMHVDALERGQEVLIVDDVIATGGTARAAGELVLGLGARVAAYAFLVELTFLNGRDKLKGSDILTLIRY